MNVENVKHSSELAAHLLHEAPAGFVVIDPFEDRILAANDTAAKQFGSKPGDLRGLNASVVFRSCMPTLFSLTEACLDGRGSWVGDLAVATDTRGVVEFEVHASRTTFGEMRAISLLLFDLRRLRRRQARAEFEAHYRENQVSFGQADRIFRQLERGSRLILNAAGEGIYGVNEEGVTTFVNTAAERMLGWKAEEIVGRVAHTVMHHSHECGDAYPIEQCPIYAAFRDGAVHSVQDEVFWRKDGTCFPVEYTSTPIEDDGQPVGAVVVFRDVSARREQESALKKALEENEQLRARLERENAYLIDELVEHHNRHEIVGNSPAIAHIVQQIDLVAPTEATVLITGESGTGKELIARAIHNASLRKERPLIRVNCAAIPSELFESEFFGHVKGAFTGALTSRTGRFELADGGTLFLDEVGELPLDQQGKLLRVLQEQQFERVGDTRTTSVDVRVIAATNRELRHAIMEKQFREDLYFRLAVFPIHSAPLRERLSDIEPLARLFVERAATRVNRYPRPRLTEANIEELMAYDWPGNIRELENVIERAVIVAHDGRLSFNLKPSGSTAISARTETNAAARPAITALSEVRRLEQDAIVEALRESRGKVSGDGGAAERLGLKPTTLYARLKKLGIDARQFK